MPKLFLSAASWRSLSCLGFRVTMLPSSFMIVVEALASHEVVFPIVSSCQSSHKADAKVETQHSTLLLESVFTCRLQDVPEDVNLLVCQLTPAKVISQQCRRQDKIKKAAMRARPC